MTDCEAGPREAVEGVAWTDEQILAYLAGESKLVGEVERGNGRDPHCLGYILRGDKGSLELISTPSVEAAVNLMNAIADATTQSGDDAMFAFTWGRFVLLAPADRADILFAVSGFLATGWVL